MGENNCWEREVVITELTKGKEFMLQLQKHFDPMKQDVCQYLAVEVLSSYDKALSLLNGTTLSGTNKMVQRSETETEALAFEVSYGESHSCGQEKKNQNEQVLLPVQQQTKCDEVRIREISECDNHEMVSTPNNPFNSDFIATLTSSPLPDTDNNSLTDLLFHHDVPENANKSSADNYISHNAEWNLSSLDNFSTLFDDNCNYRGVRKNALGKWAAEIRNPDCGTPIWLGTFENSHDAAVAYDAVAYKLYGENANFNFPHRYNKQAENNLS